MISIEKLKQLLIASLNRKRTRQWIAVNQEIVGQLIQGTYGTEVAENQVSAYQLNGTLIFLSESGLPMPKRIAFVDVRSGTSFLQEVEG